jgi:hypothetical protein
MDAASLTVGDILGDGHVSGLLEEYKRLVLRYEGLVSGVRAQLRQATITRETRSESGHYIEGPAGAERLTKSGAPHDEWAGNGAPARHGLLDDTVDGASVVPLEGKMSSSAAPEAALADGMSSSDILVSGPGDDLSVREADDETTAGDPNNEREQDREDVTEDDHEDIYTTVEGHDNNAIVEEDTVDMMAGMTVHEPTDRKNEAPASTSQSDTHVQESLI